MSSLTATKPWWQRRQTYVLIGAVILVVLMILDTKVIGPDDEEEVASDTAEEYADEAYESIVVAGVKERAIPIAELVDQMLDDPEAAGEEHGNREDDDKPYSFAVSAQGTVEEGGFGEVGLDIDGLDSDFSVGIAVPPLGSTTALRDASGEVSFGDFVNQTEYQNVALELNNKAAEDVFADLDPDDLEGEDVTVIGAVKWTSDTGGEVDAVAITPVEIEVGS